MGISFEKFLKKIEDNGKRKERIRVMSILRKVLNGKMTFERALKKIYVEE